MKGAGCYSGAQIVIAKIIKKKIKKKTHSVYIKTAEGNRSQQRKRGEKRKIDVERSSR